MADGDKDLVEVIAIEFGPSEAEAEEHLRGVGVVAVGLLCRLAVRHVLISQHRSQERCFLGIKRFLLHDGIELLVLDQTQFGADLLESREHIAQEPSVGVVGLEDGTLVRRVRQEDNRFGGLVDRRELGQFVKLLVGAAAEHLEDLDTAHIAVGSEIDLELTVVTAGSEVTDTHDLGFQPFMDDGIQDKTVGKELGAHILVIQVLPEIEIPLRQFR